MMRKSSPEIVTFPKAEKEAVRIAAYVGDRETEQQLHELFGRWGYETTYIQKGRIPDARRDYANRNMPPVLIVDISDAALPLSELKTLADICPPEVNVVALGTRDTVGLYRDLMEIGVTDYLVKPVPADLLFRAIARASGQKAGRQMDARTGKTVAVFGVRGGVGATTAVASLGWLLAHHYSRHVMMTDLNLGAGSLALDLGEAAGGGLAELLSSPERIDEMVIERATLSIGDKLRLLAGGSDRPGDGEYDAQAVEALMSHLRPRYHFIFQDLDRARPAASSLLLERADIRILILEPTLAAVRDAARLVTRLGEGEARQELFIIVNRGRDIRSGDVPTEKIAEVVGRPVDLVIPFERRRLAVASLNGEAAMQRKSAVQRAYLRFAGILVGQGPARPRRTRWPLRL